MSRRFRAAGSFCLRSPRPRSRLRSSCCRRRSATSRSSGSRQGSRSGSSACRRAALRSSWARSPRSPCVTIQQLVREARLRATDLIDRAAELEEAARQLAVQNEKLRELDHLKDDFVGLVSHELRTPLTSIMGYLEMVLEEHTEQLTADQRQFLATVNRNVERLATLVNELLFLVQVDAGRLELTLASEDIVELVAEATEAARPAAN